MKVVLRGFSRIAGIALLMLIVSAGLVWGSGTPDSGATSSGGTTMTAAPTQFSQAPMLDGVAGLPPVEERLPENPLVVEPVEGIGKYGGTWNRWNDHPRIFAWEPLVKVDSDGSMYPNVAESWVIGPDYKTFTFQLRRGIKWSDGAPYTSEDIMFYWEDLAKNEELTQRNPGGAGMEITAPDDYTIVISFPDPQPTYMLRQSIQWGGDGFVYSAYPKHYLKQFHPAYADKDELAATIKAAGMETWMQLMDARYYVESNPDLPVLTPWRVTTDPSAPTQRCERNPYYWKVDPEGNQLPYIDYAIWPLQKDKEVALLKIASGEIHFTTEAFTTTDFPVLVDYAAQGGYEIRKEYSPEYPSLVTMYINQTYQKDEQDAAILQNLKFRQALSVAIDRDEINEFIGLGQGEAVQASLGSDHPNGSDELKYYMIDYEPAKSNSLLDEIGMDKRDSEGFRLRPDGKKFTFILSPRAATNQKAAEIMKTHFEDVGIRTVVSIEDQSFWFQNKNNGLHMVSMYSLSNGHPEYRDTWWIPINLNCYWGVMYGTWVSSKGEQGVEPEGVIAEIIEKYQAALIETDDAKRDELMDFVVETVTKNLYMIGTISRPPTPLPVKNNFKGIPKELYLHSTRMDVWEYSQVWIDE